MDKMFIEDLEVDCIIGTNPEERINKQTVRINLALECDLSTAGRTDDLGDTVNYKALYDGIVALVEGSEYFLIEHMADQIAEKCLQDDLVATVAVRIDKPGALTSAKSAAVEISRGRNP